MIDCSDAATARRIRAATPQSPLTRAVKTLGAVAIGLLLASGVSIAQDAAPAASSAPAAVASPSTDSAAASASAAPVSTPAAKARPAIRGEAVSGAKSPAEMFNFSQGSGPIKIKSDKMNFDQKQKMVRFSGHVRADRSDGELTCDTLHVLFTDEKLHDISQMIAEGNVRISQGPRYATSDRAVMDQLKRTVVLTGNPVVHDGQDQIAGTRITTDLNTGESVVEGARAVIFPRRSENADNSTSIDHAR